LAQELTQRRAELAGRRARLSVAKRASLEDQIQASSGGDILEVIPRRPVFSPVLTSFAQQRLWFLDQLDADKPIYNMPLAVRLTGVMRVFALEQDLGEVFRRHEVLRTTFVSTNGEPLQVIGPALRYELRIVDLVGVGNGVNEIIGRLSTEEAQRPFDLGQGPLLRTTLIRVNDVEHALHLTVHHIVSDGWSMGVLIDELGELYRIYSSGEPSTLAELQVQYADYACWQRHWLKDAVLEGELNYWRRQLEEAPSLLELPSDRPRPAVQTFRGGSYMFAMSSTLSESLRALSRNDGTTLFMTMLAALKILLSRWTGGHDIVVGTPVAGRRWVETEGLIGLFVNTLVLRTKFSERTSVKDMLAFVRDSVLDAQTHQDLPFEKLVEDLQPQRSLSHSPLFQVMFIVQNAPPGSVKVQELTFQGIDFKLDSAKFDLTIAVVEGRESLVCGLTYNVDLFEETTIKRLSKQWEETMKAVVGDSGKLICEISGMSAEEQHQIVVEWNDTRCVTETPHSLVDLFEREVERQPDALAVRYGNGEVSYGELNRRANQLAHYLAERGVSRDGVVGICLERSVDMIAGLLAILKTGAAYLPLDPTYPNERIEFMIRDSAATLVVTQHHLVKQLTADIGMVCLDTDLTLIERQHSHNPTGTTTSRNLAYIIYTSGSTGQPRGVKVEHRSVVNLLFALDNSIYRAAASSQLRISLNGSLAFDTSVKQLIQLLRGHTLVIIPEEVRYSGDALLSFCLKNAVDVLDCTPAILRDVFSAGFDQVSEGDPSMVLVGGEAIEAPLWHALIEDSKTKLFNVYGPTECTVDSTASSIDTEHPDPVIGRPLANVQAFVLDDFCRPVPMNVPGELCIAGSGVAHGYHGCPDLTAEKFIPNPFGDQSGSRLYRTGDKTRYLQDASLQYLGRMDDQVKVRGHRVEPAEIESALLQLPSVANCAVIVKPDYVGTNRLVAYVVSKNRSAVTVSEIKNHLRQKLPEYMVPSLIVKIEEMPLTPNGKVDRVKLRGIEERRKGGEEGGEERREGRWVEEVIGGIWGEVLGVEEVRGSDNFFEIGGHSLLATQVVSRMREVFGVEIGLRGIFEEPRLEGLSRRVEEEIRGGEDEEWKKITRGVRKAKVPLSYAQTRLWFLEELEPGRSTYNVPMGVRIEGELNVRALEESFSEVIRRHETLRTVFRNEENGPVQVIGGAEPKTIRMIDVSGLEEKRREKEVRKISEEETREPFDLRKGPLMRVTVMKERGDTHLLMVTMHHVITDGWSMGVLVREVTEIYEAEREGRAVDLEELEIQYGDYAVWQRENMSGERLGREVRYWRKKLQGAPEVVEMPTDRPRPAMQTYGGGEEGLEVREEVARGLKELGRKERATIFMTMMAGLKILLYRWSGQRDTVVGTPIANRNRAELEGIIGFFVNTLVIRTELEGGESIASVVRKVRETSIGAYAHQDVPFEKLVEEMRPNRSLSYSPMFQVMMLMQNERRKGGEVSGLKMRTEGSSSGTAKFDLMVGVMETGEELRVGVGYNRDLYDRETIKRMCEHLGRILEEMGKGGERGIGEIELMREWERQQVLVEWNDTRREGSERKSIVEMFEREAERGGDRVAIRRGEEEISYGELNRRSNQLGNYLVRKGLGREGLVLICMERSVEMVIGMMGVMKGGGAYVPLDPKYPRERMEMIEEDAGGGMILTQKELGRRIWGEGKEGMIGVDEEWEEISKESSENREWEIRGEDQAYVIYTSGSTGKPKGVGIEHGSVVELAEWAGEEYGEEGLSRVIATTSICFDLSIFEILVVLGRGGRVCLMRDVLEVEGSEEVAGGGGMVLNTVPSAAAELIRMGGIRGGIETVNLAGEVLHQGLVEEVYKRKGVEKVYNLYGPTEDTTYTTYAKVRGGGKEGSVVIGRPIRNTEIYVLDERMQAAPIGVVGEIYIGGKGLARGYRGRGELTAERFISNPYGGGKGSRMYRTGDLGRRGRTGELEYIGRRDQQVKVRGFRIELGEIEAALKGEKEIEEAVVVAREEDGGGKRLVGYVVIKDGERISASELKAVMRQKLPEYMVPSLIVKIEEMPLTPNGKVDRRRLPEPGRSAVLEKRFIEPRDHIEKMIARIWEEVLGIKPVGVTDNFFVLGGHSLLAVRLMSQIERAFNKKLPLATLFREPTVAHIADLVRPGNGKGFWSPLVNLQPLGSKPAFFCVHPAGGQVFCYAKLARHLGTERPFYGIQAHGLDGLQPIETSIQSMARQYIEALLMIQPGGPYLLGGWSMGGVIAFEMAQLLKSAGEEVALLALIDSRAPNGETSTVRDEELLNAFANDLGLKPSQLSEEADYLTFTGSLSRILSLAKDTGRFSPNTTVSEFQRYFEIFKTNMEAMRIYIPSRYAGRITLFSADGSAALNWKDRVARFFDRMVSKGSGRANGDQKLGWGQWAVDGIECHPVPGNHYTLVDEPGVELLAGQIRRCIQEAEARRLK
jgi:amino acid adenylation domain-containing protein